MVQGLQLMSTLNVPIYITETGIADAAGDRRPLWLQTYIPEVIFQSQPFLCTIPSSSGGDGQNSQGSPVLESVAYVMNKGITNCSCSSAACKCGVGCQHIVCL